MKTRPKCISCFGNNKRVCKSHTSDRLRFNLMIVSRWYTAGIYTVETEPCGKQVNYSVAFVYSLSARIPGQVLG